MRAIKRYFVPMFAETVRPRVLALFVAGIGAAQLGLSCTLHIGFPCAFHQATGLPCPGCGLTRSVLALLQGRPYDSFEYHPFGSLLLAGLLFSLVVGVLPRKSRDRLINLVERVEIKTGITLFALLLFMLLWAVRITGVLPLYKV